MIDVLELQVIRMTQMTAVYFGFSALIAVGCRPATAFASTQECRAFQSWETLARVHSVDLPARTLMAIRENPVTQELREKYGTGKGLVFHESHIGMLGNGWGIQSQFLNKIVQTIFPDCRIDRPFYKDGDKIDLYVSEHPKPEKGPSSMVSIADLKLANSATPIAPKAAVRNQLGLPEGSKIVSLYSAAGGYEQTPSTIERLFREARTDYVILSMQRDDSVLVRSLEGTGPAVMTSSEWSTLNRETRPKKAIIVNETRGRMPSIHAAADFAIVLGSGNIMESINAGRPTYFFKNPVRSEEAEVWKQISEAAQATGAGHPFTTEKELFRLIQQTQSTQPAFRQRDFEATITRILEPIALMIEEHFAQP